MTMRTREERINEMYAELCAMYDAEDLRNELLLDQLEREAANYVDIEDWIASTPREERCRIRTNAEPEPESEPEQPVIVDEGEGTCLFFWSDGTHTVEHYEVQAR